MPFWHETRIGMRHSTKGQGTSGLGRIRLMAFMESGQVRPFPNAAGPPGSQRDTLGRNECSCYFCVFPGITCTNGRVNSTSMENLLVLEAIARGCRTFGG